MYDCYIVLNLGSEKGTHFWAKKGTFCRETWFWGHIILRRRDIMPHTNIGSISILDKYDSTCTTI